MKNSFRSKIVKIKSIFASAIALVLVCNTCVYASEAVNLSDYAEDDELVNVVLETIPVEDIRNDEASEDSELQNADGKIEEETGEDSEADTIVTDDADTIVEDEADPAEDGENLKGKESDKEEEDPYEEYRELIDKLTDLDADGTLSVNLFTDLEYNENKESYIPAADDIKFSLERRIIRNDVSVVDLIDDEEEDTLAYMMLTEEEAEEVQEKTDNGEDYEYGNFSFEWPLEKIELKDAMGGLADLEIPEDFTGYIYYFAIDENGIRTSGESIHIEEQDESEGISEEPADEVTENETADEELFSDETDIDTELSEDKTEESEEDPEVSEDENNIVSEELPAEEPASEETEEQQGDEDAIAVIPPEEKNLLDIDEEDKEIISMEVPTSFEVLMLPYEDGTVLVLGEDIVMKNDGANDVTVNISNISVNILKDNVDNNISKTCNLEMTIVDSEGEKTIELSEGDNTGIYSGVISGSDSSENGNEVVLKLSGRVEDGSNDYWRSGDLKVRVTYDFKHEPDTSEILEDNKSANEEAIVEDIKEEDLAEASADEDKADEEE